MQLASKPVASHEHIIFSLKEYKVSLRGHHIFSGKTYAKYRRAQVRSRLGFEAVQTFCCSQAGSGGSRLPLPAAEKLRLQQDLALLGALDELIPAVETELNASSKQLRKRYSLL